MLKIRDGVSLEELKKYGFKPKYNVNTGKIEKYVYENYENGEEEYYSEILWRYDDGINTIEILEKRENSDWSHCNKEREVYIYESDYEMGVSKSAIEKIYDLIKANLVIKE